MMRYAVRYTHPGDTDPTVTLVASPAQQWAMIRDLLADKGVVAEAGEITFVPDPAVSAEVAREFVEQTVRELVEGERDLIEVNDMLRPVSPDLLEDDDAATIRRQDRNAFLDGCVRTARIEELANLLYRAAATCDGHMDVGDRNLDAEERQREWLIRVLAGQEDHSGTDAPCHRCATVVHATARDLSGAPTPTETRKDAAA